MNEKRFSENLFCMFLSVHYYFFSPLSNRRQRSTSFIVCSAPRPRALYQIIYLCLQFKLEDCFHDYDPLRKGFVSANDFKKAFKEIFEDLFTDEQVEEMLKQYCVQDSPDCYNWPKFLHDAETGKNASPLSLNGLQLEPKVSHFV